MRSAFLAALAAAALFALDCSPAALVAAGAAEIASHDTVHGELVADPLGGVPPDDPRMEAYSHGIYVLALVGSAFSVVLLAAIVASGLGARLRAAAERVTRRPNPVTALTVVLLTCVTFLASLPLHAYGGFVREKRYGFANQSFALWMWDRVKGLGVELVMQVIFFVLVYVAIRRLGRRWWIAGTALGIVSLVGVLAVEPVFVAPLFNRFTPLADAELRGQILAMARGEGIPADEVYEVDASRQSEHNNAYVAGLFGTERVVLYDTLLGRFSPREIRFVMAHEMGHYVLHHIWQMVVFLSLLIALGFWIVDRGARAVIARWPGFGIRGLDDAASLPLLLLIFAVLSLGSLPIVNGFSRMQEHAADRFAIELTRDPAAAASSFIKFGRSDLGEYRVNPLIERLLYSHPSLGHRIEFAQQYARSHPGESPRSWPSTAPAPAG